MIDVSALLDALGEAARANDQREFDRLERDLLAHFDGGFAGMPRDVYDRYLEVDRAWPTRPTARQGGRGGPRPGAGRPVGPLGPRLPLNARVPERLYEWLNEVGAVTGRNRSDVLGECLLLVREDAALEETLFERLRAEREDDAAE